MAPFWGAVVVPQFSHGKQPPRTCIRHQWPVRKIPIESLSAKKPGKPGFLLVIRKDHSAISNNGHPCPPQLHPVVVPQSSHTMQWPLTFMRIELQLLHWSPV